MGRPPIRGGGTPTPTPRRGGTPTPTPAPKPTPAPAAAAALSIDDVKLLRDRIERFAATPTTAPAPTGNPASDAVMALVAEKLGATRAEDERRLTDVQAKLTAAERGAAAAQERLKGLEATLGERDTTAKADAERIAALETKLAEAGEAARKDAARIEALEAELAAHRAETDQALGESDTGLADALETVDALTTELAALQMREATATKELAAASDRLARALREADELRVTQKPQADGTRVLGAESVAALLDDFVGSFKTRLDGLQVASGEVQLKTAFAAIGDRATFVLPAAGAKTADLPVLHEIRLKLDPQR